MTCQQVSKDNDGNNITTSVDVSLFYKSHVRVVQGYVSYRMNIGKPIDDWLTVAEEDISNIKCHVNIKLTLHIVPV